VARTRIDYYAILGIDLDANVADIRRAFKRHSRRFHPALNPGDPTAAERFASIASAYEVLSDPQRRDHYDHGGDEVRATPTAPEVGFEGFDFSPGTRRGGVGFKEIFNEVLRRDRVAPGSATPGEDLEHVTRLSFAEALTGARRTVRLTRQERCPPCEGTGDVAAGSTACPACGGAGRVRATRGHMIFTRACVTCGSRGVIDVLPCGRCKGEGRVPQVEALEIEIPGGVRAGSRIEVPGGGNAGRRGGPVGDFALVIELEPHPMFERVADDLVCRVPIAITEAALGAHIEVPTPEGPLTIQIPAGTQAGQRFRLLKRGMPRLERGGRGDLYIEVELRVPRIEDERSRQLLEEFARLNHSDLRKDLVDTLPAATKEG
jgi:molecular chaperone DnaJ